MKQVKKILLIGVPLLIVLGYLVFVFVNINKEEKVGTPEGVAVEITNSAYNFINEEEVVNLTTKEMGQLDKLPYDSINKNKIELLLQKNPFVEDVQVFRAANNTCRIQVTQRTPILRVWTAKENYYLDKDGFRMPTGIKYPALVHLYRGAVKEEFAKRFLVKFQKYLDENPFWAEMIDYVSVNEKEELTLYLRVEAGKVLFGKVTDIAMKLDKLLLFIEKVGTHNGLKMYKTIDLRFKNQVVVKKK